MKSLVNQGDESLQCPALSLAETLTICFLEEILFDEDQTQRGSVCFNNFVGFKSRSV